MTSRAQRPAVDAHLVHVEVRVGAGRPAVVAHGEPGAVAVEDAAVGRRRVVDPDAVDIQRGSLLVPPRCRDGVPLPVVDASGDRRQRRRVLVVDAEREPALRGVQLVGRARAVVAGRAGARAVADDGAAGRRRSRAPDPGQDAEVVELQGGIRGRADRRGRAGVAHQPRRVVEEPPDQRRARHRAVPGVARAVGRGGAERVEVPLQQGLVVAAPPVRSSRGVVAAGSCRYRMSSSASEVLYTRTSSIDPP